MNPYILKNAQIPALGIVGDVFVQDGIILDIGQLHGAVPAYDLKGEMLLAGFIDQHTHGALGIDVNHASVSDLIALKNGVTQFGTTTFCPTILSDTDLVTKRCVENIVAASKDFAGAQIAGFHLEGPFLAPEYKGAMPERFLQKPNVDVLDGYLDISQGLFKIITLAPELEGIEAVISYAVEKGIAVSLGHTGATYEQTVSAIESGATGATHTFNAMKLLHQHYPAVLGAVLEQDVYCEAIFDGRHLCPAIVRLLLKTKGFERVIAITDSIMAAGMPDGNYKLGANDIVVKDGDAQLANGNSRAGSTLTTIDALKNLIQFTGCSVAQASTLLSENPAKFLGIDHKTGSIAVGKQADLVVVKDDLSLKYTIVNGEFAYGDPT